MDQSTLVSAGHALVTEMDKAGFRPRLAMWVHNTDADTWKLWLLPPAGKEDKNEFYRVIVEIISKNREKFGDIDAADTQMVPENHAVVKGLKKFIRAPELSAISFSGNTFNGYYLPDGIIMRSDI